MVRTRHVKKVVAEKWYVNKTISDYFYHIPFAWVIIEKGHINLKEIFYAKAKLLYPRSFPYCLHEVLTLVSEDFWCRRQTYSLKSISYLNGDRKQEFYSTNNRHTFSLPYNQKACHRL